MTTRELKQTIAIMLLMIIVGVGINSYLENRSSEAVITLGETKVKTVQTTESDVVNKETVNYSFYKGLEDSVLEVDATAIVPEGLMEDPILIIRGEEKPLEGELRCMAVTLYLEGRSRTERFQEATAWSVISRINKYGNNSVCDAVKNARRDASSGLLVKFKCHYSYFCEGKPKLIVAENPIEDKAYRTAVRIASKVLTQHKAGKTNELSNITHYFREDKDPGWQDKMQLIAKIEDHYFYHGH